LTHNNDVLYDAAFLGCIQGATTTTGPGISVDPATYATLALRCAAFAVVMDQAIPAQVRAPTLNEAVLLVSLCAGYWAGRFPSAPSDAHYQQAAKVLAAKFTELKASLVNAPALGIAQAVVSFQAKCVSPMVGPNVFSIEPLPQTFGATFVGFTEPQTGVVVAEYHLDAPIPANKRVVVSGIQLTDLTTAFSPFIPLGLNLAPGNDNQFLEGAGATNPFPDPGSPDVIVEFQTIIYRVA